MRRMLRMVSLPPSSLVWGGMSTIKGSPSSLFPIPSREGLLKGHRAHNQKQKEKGKGKAKGITRTLGHSDTRLLGNSSRQLPRQAGQGTKEFEERQHQHQHAGILYGGLGYVRYTPHTDYLSFSSFCTASGRGRRRTNPSSTVVSARK